MERWLLIGRREFCAIRRLFGPKAQLCCKLSLGDYRDQLVLQLSGVQENLLQADCRVGFVGLVDDLLKLVVRDDVQAVHRRDASTLAVWQAQATADGLLDQDARVRRTQRHDRVQVGNVPTFFEHVDVNDDFSRLLRVLDLKQPLDHFVFFGASLAGIHLDDFLLVSTLEEASDWINCISWLACVVSRAMTSTNGFTIALSVSRA